MHFYKLARLACLAAFLVSPVASGQVSIRVNNIITVGAAGDSGVNCLSLRTVLGSILDSESLNPYHVKLEPGDYDCGNLGGDSILVPPFVTVEGSSVDTTVIRGTKNGALINLMNGSELRLLTVRNEGGAGNPSTYAVGISNDSAASARVSHIRAEAGQASGESAAFAMANTDTSPSVVELVMHDSFGEGETAALKCDYPSLGTVRFSSDDSQLLTNDTTPPLQSGCDVVDARCVGSYDSEYDLVPKTCFPPPPATVFVTSTTYSGNLNGMLGGDAKCQALADDAGLGGTWTAWLSNGSGSQSAKERLIDAGALGPHRRADGVIVAQNLADLTDSSLAAPINLDENGVSRSGSVWTGTSATGTGTGLDCSNWSFVVPNVPDGTYGSTTETGTAWTAQATSTCLLSYRLYCFASPGGP